MANERNHFYYTTCESLSTNKPWDCRQHIMQKTKHNCPCHCADSHFSHLLINRPFNKHQQQEGTSLRADLELHFVQTLHTKVQLTQVNWGIIKHPDVLLWRQCIFFFLLLPASFYLTVFSGYSTSTPKLCACQAFTAKSAQGCVSVLQWCMESRQNQDCCLFEERDECAIFQITTVDRGCSIYYYTVF